jgi:hypothetical protein
MNKNTRISIFREKPYLPDEPFRHTLPLTSLAGQYMSGRTYFLCSNDLKMEGTKAEP